MSNPITLSAAAIGALALTEGIKFLYSQAGEILKRWIARKKEMSQTPAKKNDNIETTEVVLPDVFEGKLDNPKIHFDKVRELESDLRKLRKELTDYVEEIQEVDGKDTKLLKTVDALRNLIEVIYQQCITFQGEKRPTSGSLEVLGLVEAKKIAGEAIGVDVEHASSGKFRGEVKADSIEPDGKAIGAKLKNV